MRCTISVGKAGNVSDSNPYQFAECPLIEMNKTTLRGKVSDVESSMTIETYRFPEASKIGRLCLAKPYSAIQESAKPYSAKPYSDKPNLGIC